MYGTNNDFANITVVHFHFGLHYGLLNVGLFYCRADDKVPGIVKDIWPMGCVKLKSSIAGWNAIKLWACRKRKLVDINLYSPVQSSHITLR